MGTSYRRDIANGFLLPAAIWLTWTGTAFGQGKAPVPDAAVQAKAVELVRELYQQDYSQARLPAEWTALAKKVLQQATRAEKGTADHFALLKEGRDIAVRAGDIGTALSAVRDLVNTYDLDAVEMELETLIETGGHAGLTKDRQAVIERSMPWIASALADEDYATAARLLQMAVPVARKTREGDLIQEVDALDRRVRAAANAYARAQESLEVLNQNPIDPEANYAVGWYYCLHKGEWEKGIPMLALGSDEQLKALAIKELERADSPEDRIALGDAWWDLAQAKEDDERTALLFCAGFWYRPAHTKAASLLIQMRVQRRLDEIAELERINPGFPARKLPRAVAPFEEKQAERYQEAWASYLGVPVELTNSIGMKLVLIPPGEFDMGSNEEEIERLLEQAEEEDRPKFYRVQVSQEGPRHRVRITRPFYLGMYEVTQAEYQSVMGANPSMYSPAGTRKGWVAGRDTSRFPVEMVSWEDASRFCDKLSALAKEKSAGRVYRLPTEAEWEYACRAGTTTQYSFGNDEARVGEYAWFRKNSANATHPVGQKKPNAWWLYDMHGNAWEWCMDWHANDYYQNSPADDPQGPSTGWGRVTRGSCFDAAFPQQLRCPHRGGVGPTAQHCWIGFRAAMTLEP